MSKPQTVTIDDVEYVRKDSQPDIPRPQGRFVIVRCLNAGVHAGYLKERTPHVLTLENSRRLWRWWSEFTLSELANKGPRQDKLEYNKYADTVALLDLTASDVAEVLYCSEQAKVAIEAVESYRE